MCVCVCVWFSQPRHNLACRNNTDTKHSPKCSECQMIINFVRFWFNFFFNFFLKSISSTLCQVLANLLAQSKIYSMVKYTENPDIIWPWVRLLNVCYIYVTRKLQIYCWATITLYLILPSFQAPNSFTSFICNQFDGFF
jgi:hypothetical protein